MIWLSTRGHIKRGQEDEPTSSDRTAIATGGLSPRPIGGLSSQEAAARLITFDPNEPAATRQYSGVLDYVRTLASPLVLILLCAIADSSEMVTVKIVTGDTALVGHSLCKEVGLDGSRIITGQVLPK